MEHAHLLGTQGHWFWIVPLLFMIVMFFHVPAYGRLATSSHLCRPWAIQLLWTRSRFPFAPFVRDAGPDSRPALREWRNHQGAA